MSKTSFACAIALTLSIAIAASQVPRITEGDLLKDLDTLNLDPSNKQPSGLDALASKKDKAPSQTEITADNAEFNNKTHIAIFNGDVVVKNPEFNVKCDKLTAYLKHDAKPELAPGEKPKPAAATPAASPSTSGADGTAKPKGKSGGLEKAVCEMKEGGKVVITQDKKEADGTSTHSIGKGDKAVYDAVSGDVTLTGWPEVKQGINSGIAVEEGAVIIMTRDGKMRTTGRVKFLIQDSGNDKPASEKSR